MADRYTAEDVTVSGVDGDVVVEQAQDVYIEPDAVGGNLVIENAEDVVVSDAVELRVDSAADVVVEDGAVEGGSVTVGSTDDEV